MKVTEFIDEIKKIDCVDYTACSTSSIHVYIKDDYVKNFQFLVIDIKNGSFTITNVVFKTLSKSVRKKLIRLCTKYALSSEAVNEDIKPRFYSVTHCSNGWGLHEGELVYNDKIKEYRMRKSESSAYVDGDRKLLTKKELDKYFKNHSTKGMHIKIRVKD